MLKSWGVYGPRRKAIRRQLDLRRPATWRPGYQETAFNGQDPISWKTKRSAGGPAWYGSNKRHHQQAPTRTSAPRQRNRRYYNSNWNEPVPMQVEGNPVSKTSTSENIGSVEMKEKNPGILKAGNQNLNPNVPETTLHNPDGTMVQRMNPPDPDGEPDYSSEYWFNRAAKNYKPHPATGNRGILRNPKVINRANKDLADEHASKSDMDNSMMGILALSMMGQGNMGGLGSNAPPMDTNPQPLSNAVEQQTAPSGGNSGVAKAQEDQDMVNTPELKMQNITL